MRLTENRQMVSQSVPMGIYDIQPIDQAPEYRQVAAKLHGLEQRLADSERQHTELVAERRRLSSNEHISFLTSQFLEGDIPDVASIQERVAVQTDQIKALRKAIELGRQELGRVRSRLSVEAVERFSGFCREQARKVLRGMLNVELANGNLVLLREQLELRGYAAGTITPVGAFAPWPCWGSITDPGSLWRMVLAEFVGRGFISDDDHRAIISGDLRGFQP